jgi:hypothetical protein
MTAMATERLAAHQGAREPVRADRPAGEREDGAGAQQRCLAAEAEQRQQLSAEQADADG